jgi:hypothetical protein
MVSGIEPFLRILRMTHETMSGRDLSEALQDVAAELRDATRQLADPKAVSEHGESSGALEGLENKIETLKEIARALRVDRGVTCQCGQSLNKQILHGKYILVCPACEASETVATPQLVAA